MSTEAVTAEEGRLARRIDAVVLDLDGTLADTFPLLLVAFDAASRAVRDRALTRAEMVAHFGPGAGTEEMIVAALTGREDAADVDAFFAAYAARHGELVTLFPGLREGLEVARGRGCGTGLLTGKGRRSTEITLRELGVADLFDVVVTGDDAPAPKPDPRGLLSILDRLAVPPSRALFVGDSIADVGAGRAAGTLVAAAHWNDPDDAALRARAPDFALHTGDDLRDLIERLTGR